MARMPWSHFRSLLKKLNRDIVMLTPAQRSEKSTMVYLHAPMSRDADPRGLVELLAVPSTSFYTNGFPKDDFRQENGKWSRGYNSFFAILSKMKVDRRRVVKKPELLQGLVHKRDYSALKAAIREENLPQSHKDFRKHKHIFKPYEVEENGGQRESSTLYSLPASGSLG